MQAHRLANTNGVIFLSAYEITGTANFSQIQSAIQNLQSSLNGIKAPTITPQVNLSGAGGVMSGLKSSLMSEAGNFAGVGQTIGQNLTMGMTSQFGMAGNVAGSLVTALGPVGIAAGIAGAGLLAVGGAAVSTAANWETLMASVSKTTGIEGAGLDKLSSDLQNIRMQTGATAEEIANAVTTAGSIGIPSEELASFAQVAMQMGSAFNMSAETAANAMGKIGNVVKPAEMSWTEFATKGGSAINDLADSMATSEEQILTGMTHLGSIMGLLKPPADTIPAWTALVATVQSLGLAGDAAGEAVQDALQYATRNNKGKISELLGISNEELQINLRTNAPEVLQEAAQAIAALPLEEQGEALQAFGMTGQKAIALLMGDLDKTTGEFDKFGNALDTANKGWKEGASLAAAYGKSQETFNAAMDRLGASLDVAGQKLGTVLLPYLAQGIDLLTSGVQAAIRFGESVSNLIGDGIGGIFGTNKEDMYQEIVDKKRAAEAGKGAGDAIGEGIKESDALAKAPGETLGSDTASAEVKKSAEELAKDFAKEFSTTMQDQAIDKAISQAASRAGNENINRNKGNVAGFVSTTLENGLKLDVAYQGRSGNIMSRLFIDGEQIGSEVYGKDREDSLRKLLVGYDYNQANLFDLTDNPGQAAILRATKLDVTDIYTAEEQAAFKANNDAIWSNFGDSTATILSDNFDFIQQHGSQKAKDAINKILDAFAHPDANKLNDVSNLFKQIEKEMIDPKQAGNLAKTFETAILPHITNMKEFMQVQGEDMGKSITDSFSDSFLSVDERAAIAAMDPMLDTLIKEAPEAAKEAGLASIEAFVEAAKSGASDAKLDAMWDGILKKLESKKEEAKSLYSGSGGGLFYGEFVDPNAQWSDYLTDEGGYAGPTELWAERETEIEKRNQQISASLSELDAMKHPLEFEATINTAAALDDITSLENEITGSDVVMTITADTTIAEDRWMNLYKLIENNPVTMQVNLALSASAQELRQMVRSEIADAIASA